VAIIRPVWVAIELASILTWDKNSNATPSSGQYAGPLVLVWDHGPYMPQLTRISILLYFSSAHCGVDNTFDCICLDLTWKRSYGTTSLFENKMTEVFLFGNVPVVSLYWKVTWLDSDVISCVCDKHCKTYDCTPYTLQWARIMTKLLLKWYQFFCYDLMHLNSVPGIC